MSSPVVTVIENVSLAEAQLLMLKHNVTHLCVLSDARSLIGLVYPENFTIRENKIQTARVNKIIESIYLINNELRDKKNGTKDDFYLLSRRVTSTGFKPVTF